MIRFFFVIMAVSIFGSWILWAGYSATFFEWFVVNKKGLENPGVWGDSFGALNALFGAFGFLAVLLTLITQQKALQRQQDDLHKQRFESSFFELLKLLRECRDQVSVLNRTSNWQKGVDAFETAVNDVTSTADRGEPLPAAPYPYCALYRNNIHLRYEIYLSPYFRVIYRILTRLDEDNVLSENEKLSYAKLLRGQLSSSELAVLGMNAQMPAAKDMSRLIIRFRMLKYLPEGAIKQELGKIYPAVTFKGHGDA